MTHQVDFTRLAVAEAIDWMKRSRWPTRANDFAIARNILKRHTQQDGLLQALVVAFGGPMNPEAVHRAILCRVVIHAARADSDPTTGRR